MWKSDLFLSWDFCTHSNIAWDEGALSSILRVPISTIWSQQSSNRQGESSVCYWVMIPHQSWFIKSIHTSTSIGTPRAIYNSQKYRVLSLVGEDPILPPGDREHLSCTSNSARTKLILIYLTGAPYKIFSARVGYT